MPSKFMVRTIRNLAFRNRPYFAHLAITHRCNLKCSFCHIQDTKFEELDTDGMCCIIDKLDKLGVAVISISGGGEPLVRQDFAEIVDYAAFKGIYTKLTSNGTMPQIRYEQLLRSNIREIGISLDGVTGNELPFAHVGPPILKTLRYLNDNLPSGKSLTINVTVTESNRDRVQEIVDHCAREYPRARVWLNPVVTGDGALRSAESKPVAPTYLRTTKSPALLSARFYADAVERQFCSPRFDWGCKAGSMFFDIKPNGDFWLCQDLPSRTPINILDPDFRTKLRAADFSYRKECSGCTYSCYYVPQNGFVPKNWPDMSVLWWQANTHPGERCRQVAESRGWLAGLGVFLLARLRPTPAVAACLMLLLLAAAGALAEAPQSLSPEGVIACMEISNQRRQERLQAYRSERIYSAANSFLKRSAKALVEVTYRPPGEKTFRVLDQKGSGIIHKRVILQLLRTECRNAGPEARSATDIHRRNYVFKFVEVDAATGDFVFASEPRTRNRYLFRGKVWIDPQTCGIRKIQGSPSKSPSFWVKQTQFSHSYDIFDRFWLPATHHTDVKLKIFGESTLDIEYGSYEWLQEQIADSKATSAQPMTAHGP